LETPATSLFRVDTNSEGGGHRLHKNPSARLHGITSQKTVILKIFSLPELFKKKREKRHPAVYSKSGYLEALVMYFLLCSYVFFNM
jgi:hypothetical protein